MKFSWLSHNFSICLVCIRSALCILFIYEYSSDLSYSVDFFSIFFLDICWKKPSTINFLSFLWLFSICKWVIYFFKFNFYFWFSREGEGEAEGEIHWCKRETPIGCLPCAPTGDQTCNPAMCPDQESNWRRLGLQVDSQPTEPHWEGRLLTFFKTNFLELLRLRCWLAIHLKRWMHIELRIYCTLSLESSEEHRH